MKIELKIFHREHRRAGKQFVRRPAAQYERVAQSWLADLFTALPTLNHVWKRKRIIFQRFKLKLIER